MSGDFNSVLQSPLSSRRDGDGRPAFWVFGGTVSSDWLASSHSRQATGLRMSAS